MSKAFEKNPYRFDFGGQTLEVDYEPGESKIGLFGGNSNWRGPVWMPLNYLLIEALERYHHFYGDDLRVECPVGSGRGLTLGEVARELSARVAGLFLAGPDGRRACHSDDAPFADDPRSRDLLLVLRVLPRRDRPRSRRQPPGLDHTGAPLHRGSGACAGRRDLIGAPRRRSQIRATSASDSCHSRAASDRSRAIGVVSDGLQSA